MVTGAVSSSLDPLIPVDVQDAAGAYHTLTFVVDTAFRGYLSLPPNLIARLGLTAFEIGTVTLADQTVRNVAYYETMVLWDGTPRAIDIMELDGDPLIGSQLMFAFRLTIDFVNGGNVVLDRLP